MSEQKIKIENDSIKLGMLCLMLIAFNTCMSLIPVENPHDTGKEQLEQAKKQYTLDSLQYEQAVKFADEYKALKNRQIRADSLATDVLRKQYKMDSVKTSEYLKALKKAYSK